MKRLLSIVLTIAMVVSMFTAVSAAPTVSEFNNMLNSHFPLSEKVLARQSGTSEWSDTYTLTGNDTLDYQASLDMSSIRGLFEEEFLAGLAALQGKTLNTFGASTVSTEVTVTVTFPAAAVISADLSDENTGMLYVGGAENSQYNEVSRGISGNTWTVKYNCSDIPVSSLMNADTSNKWIGDISFELLGAVTYNTYANHIVNVDVNGSATFSDNLGTVYYKGNSSHITSFTGHILVIEPAVAPTCTTSGKTEGIKCSAHNGYGHPECIEPKDVEPLGHDVNNLVYFEEAPATCTSTGIKEHWTCLRCKTDFLNSDATGEVTAASQLVIPLTSHTFSGTNATVAATCTQDGFTGGRECTVCGTLEPRVITPALGHNIVTVNGAAATCESDGYTASKKCNRNGCGLVFTESKVIPGGHIWGDWKITKNPTETATGSKERVCSRDSNHKEVVEIPKLQHTCSVNNTVVTKPATCITDGEEQDYCACGKPVGEPRVIEKTGHSFGAKVNAVAPTCIQVGMNEHYACSKCGKFFADNATYTTNEIDIYVPKTDHTKVVVPAIKPTCTSEGLTAGEKCKVCGTVTKAQTVVAKAPHDIETLAEKTFCEENGWLAHKHCKVCNKDFTMDGKTELTLENYTIAPTGHKYDYLNVTVNPIDAATEEVTALCLNDNSHTHVFKRAVKEEEHVHSSSMLRTEKLPTCTANGYKVTVYICCGEIDDSETGKVIIPATGHTLVYIPEVSSTCYETGTECYYYCKNCGLLFDSEKNQITAPKTTDKLVHELSVETETEQYIIKKCSLCGETIKIEKTKIENKDIEVDAKDNFVDKKDKIKKDNAEKNDTTGNTEVITETTINIQERPLSPDLENEIHKNDTDNKKAGDDKVVLDINIEKKTEYKDTSNPNHKVTKDIEKESISETDETIEIKIPIPSHMKDFLDFLIHRKHINNGKKEYHEIGVYNHRNNPGYGANNVPQEYIEIHYDNNEKPDYIILHARRFSEYAIVGYTNVVNDVVAPSVGGSGGGSATYTIKFNTNGGTVVDSIKVKRGETVELPTPTRDGYRFDGWYTDPNFNVPFDTTAKINKNISLYAKWTKIEGIGGECPGTVEGGCPCFDFTDLDPTQWYHESVDYVLNNKLMNGISTEEFAPNGNLTRAMLVTVLWREEGKPEAQTSNNFEDLKAGEYYVPAVAWAESNGIVTGYSDTEFGPDDNILREQIAAIMYRYSKFKGYDVSVGENTNILSYTDYDEISEYAIPAMQYAVGSGLMKGRTETTLNPADYTTRAEIATILHRFLTTKK